MSIFKTVNHEKISSTELSLPMYYGMTEEEVSFVIDSINEFVA